MAKLVSDTYADALFDVGQELGKLDTFHQEFTELNDLLKFEDGLYDVFRTPKITKEEKKAFVNRVFGDALSHEMLNFLRVVIDKRRGYSLPSIYNAFNARYRKLMGYVTAEVHTVVLLDDAQKAALNESLNKATGKQVDIEYKVDANLIGGMRIQIGDQMIDHSVQKKIHDLKDLLIERVL